jgi:hypothetical protein
MKRALPLLLLPLWLAGCGEPPDASAPAAGEVRGQPIAAPVAKTSPALANLNSATAPPAQPASSGPAPEETTSSLSNRAAFAASSATSAAPASASLSVSDPQTQTPGPSASVFSSGSGYPLVGFDKLSGYKIEIPDDLLGPITNDLPEAKTKTEALIPDTVKAYSKKSVSLRGFMLPLKVEGGLVTELLIMKDQSMCCFGTVPKIHEWVSVKMKDKGVKPVMDQPVSLQGTLHVGEMRENGYLTGIYSMDGERLGPEE